MNYRGSEVNYQDYQRLKNAMRVLQSEVWLNPVEQEFLVKIKQAVQEYEASARAAAAGGR